MYARYKKEREGGLTRYHFAEAVSLFGCNEGLIPWLLVKQIPSGQAEPYTWHLDIPQVLNQTEYSGSALLIDLKPKQRETNLSLYEILDVWGYSAGGWTPILLHLSGLYVDADPSKTDRNSFTVPDLARDEPIYEFLYLDGSISGGKITGRWNAPPASPTNPALLWPDTLKYFVRCIRNRTPHVLGHDPA